MTATKCPHYWLIAQHIHPQSRAICKLCGAKSRFYNTIPITMHMLQHKEVRIARAAAKAQAT